MANVQVVLNQNQLGVPILNIMNWQTPDATTQTLQELVDGIRDAFATHVIDSYHNAWSMTSATVRVFDGAPPFTTEFPFTAGVLNGISVSQALPRQSALLVSLAQVGPRPNRGRQFYGGLSEGAWDSSSWNPVTQQDFVDMWSGFIAGIATTNGTCFPRIARVDHANNVWELDNPVETAVVRPYASTQKGRRQ